LYCWRTLAILSSISFITGISITKSEARIAKPFEQLIAGLVNVEIGPILTIIGGILALIAFTIKER